MIFDDFNYESFNKYILVDPNRDETDDNKVPLGDFVPIPVKINTNDKKAARKSDNVNDD
jgi:hypothetical protein